MRDLSFVWLEITGKCQLTCNHCYADSGPTGGDGAMLPGNWCRVIDEVTQLGGRMVQCARVTGAVGDLRSAWGAAGHELLLR